jgi:sn-glycerol 3-phosphate transport system ATP-binding protein
MSNVALVGAEKTYPNGFVAIPGMNLSIEQGEFLVLVGPSGCGKSTLLRMVAGLERVTGGEIRIGERVVNELEPASRNIAMVFQNYALYPHMTVFDNMAYGLRNLRTPKDEIERRVGEAARILELESLLRRKPRQLSGGQRQRVAMGRAIVREPAVFLFDEPLSNLDAKRRFVASFIGSPAMNFFDAQGDGGAQVTLSDGLVLELERHVQVPEGPVAVGVRPEHLIPGEHGTLVMHVDLVEPLGAETLLHGRLGGEGASATVRVEGESTVQAGAELRVSVQPERIHLFDAVDGRRLD